MAGVKTLGVPTYGDNKVKDIAKNGGHFGLGDVVKGGAALVYAGGQVLDNAEEEVSKQAESMVQDTAGAFDLWGQDIAKGVSDFGKGIADNAKILGNAVGMMTQDAGQAVVDTAKGIASEAAVYGQAVGMMGHDAGEAVVDTAKGVASEAAIVADAAGNMTKDGVDAAYQGGLDVANAQGDLVNMIADNASNQFNAARRVAATFINPDSTDKDKERASARYNQACERWGSLIPQGNESTVTNEYDGLGK